MKALALVTLTTFLICFGLSFVSAAMQSTSTFVTIVAMSVGFAIVTSSVKLAKSVLDIK